MPETLWITEASIGWLIKMLRKISPKRKKDSTFFSHEDEIKDICPIYLWPPHSTENLFIAPITAAKSQKHSRRNIFLRIPDLTTKFVAGKALLAPARVPYIHRILPRRVLALGVI